MRKLTLTLMAGVAALGFGSSALAADLIIEEPEDVFVEEPSSDISPYIGIFGGFAWATADHLADPPNNDLDLTGWKLGVRAGVDFNVSEAFLIGIVGDIAWSDITGDDDGAFAFDTTHTIRWQGSLRGRLGFDAGGFIPYVTGGLAVANAERTTSLGAPNSASATHVGWTLGAGVELAVAENATVNLEYRFSDFGEQVYDWSGPGTNPTIDLEEHLVTVGLNWRF